MEASEITIPSYLKHLGLDSDPFDAYSDAEAYRSKELVRVIEKLNHLIHFGNLLLLVLGERGSGKSAISKYYLENYSNDLSVCYLQADKQMTTQSIFNQIKEAFNFPVDEEQADTTATFQQLLMANESATKRVLMVDAAEELLPEVLLQLGQLTLEQRKLPEPALNIVLFADVTLNNVVTDTVFKDLGEDGIHKIELKGLRSEEIEPFVESLCKGSALKTSPFNQYQMQEIIVNSRGIPARVKAEASAQLKCLVEINESGEPESDAETTEEVFEVPVDLSDEQDEVQQIENSFKRRQLMLIGVGLAILAAVFAIQYFVVDMLQNDTTAEQTVAQSDAPSIDLVSTDAPAEGAVTPNESDPLISSDESAEADTRPEKQAEDDEALTEGIATSPEDEKAATAVEVVTLPAVAVKNVASFPSSVSPGNARAPVPAQPLPVQAEGSGAGPEPRQEQAEVTPVSSTATGNASGADAPVSAVPQNNTAVESGATVKSSDPFKKLRERAKRLQRPPATNATDRLRPADLTERDNKAMTLQIAGFSTEDAVRKYMSQYKQVEEIKYYQRQLNGKPWFVLIHGFYDTREQAVKAKAGLPQDIQKGNPWIKTVAQIKNEITP